MASGAPVTPQAVVAKVAAHFGLPVEELVGPGRRVRSTAYAQHLCWYLLRERQVPVQELAELFHCHYTTVVCGVRRIKTELGAAITETAHDVAALEKEA